MLDARTKRYLVAREFLAYTQMVTELMSVISVIPFLGMVANPTLFAEKAWMQKVADFLGAENNAELTIYLGLLSLSILVLRHALRFYIGLLSVQVGLVINHAFFRPMVRHYLSANYEFHLQHHNSVLMENLFGKIPKASQGMVGGTFGLIRTVCFFCMGATVLFVQDAYLATVGLGGVLLVLIVYTLVNNSRLTHWQKDVVAKRDELRKNLQDTLFAVEDVKMQGREREYEDNMSETHLTINSLQKRLTRIPALLNPVLEIVLYGTIVLTIIRYAAEGQAQVSITSLAVFGLVAYRMLPPLRGFYGGYVSLKNSMIAYDLVRDDLLAAHRRKELPPPVKPIKHWRHLELSDVSYRYPNAADPALDMVNFELKRGMSVGICGLSGSGKSTLIKVMLGLLRHRSGSLLLDGKKITGNYARRWQRSVAYVPQNVATLNTSMFNNIAVSLGSEHVDQKLAQRAAEMACLGDYISELRRGLHSVVGQDGKTMSTGQKQRLAIARALYRQVDCLVLDEGTSALDGMTERAVLDNIRTHMEGVTLLMVAHRINTIRSCDLIYVMRAARIEDVGTYDELFGRSEYFRKLTGLADPAEADEEGLHSTIVV